MKKRLVPIVDRAAYIAAEDEADMRRRRMRLTFCEGKEVYESRALAEQVARRRSSRGKHGEAYKCRGCGKYHMGEPIKGRSK